VLNVSAYVFALLKYAATELKFPGAIARQLLLSWQTVLCPTSWAWSHMLRPTYEDDVATEDWIMVHFSCKQKVVPFLRFLGDNGTQISNVIFLTQNKYYLGQNDV